MSTVLAAVNGSTTTTRVLEVGRAIAATAGVDFTAVYVREPGAERALPHLEPTDPDVQIIEGDPVTLLARALEDPDVVLGVIGARGDPSGPRPAGHTTCALLEQCATPLLVVPPDVAHPVGIHPVNRALVPLEGSAASTDAVVGATRLLTTSGVELIGLHVLDARTAPRFWDDSAHSIESFREEFRDRWAPTPDLEVRVRRGPAAATILRVADDEHADVIALGWSRDLGPGHAEVVQEILATTRVPALLVPVPAASRHPA